MKKANNRIMRSVVSGFGVVLVLPLLLSQASNPAMAQSEEYVKKTCGAARDAANYVNYVWTDFQNGQKTRKTYDRAYQDFSQKKQRCLAGKRKLAETTATSGVARKKAREKALALIAQRIPYYLYNSLNPSYIGAKGLGQLLERTLPQMMKRWRDTRRATDNVDNLTPALSHQNKGTLSFLSNSEKRRLKNRMEEIKYLSGLIQNGTLIGNERQEALKSIENIKLDINILFWQKGKEALFLKPKRSNQNDTPIRDMRGPDFSSVPQPRSQKLGKSVPCRGPADGEIGAWKQDSNGCWNIPRERKNRNKFEDSRPNVIGKPMFDKDNLYGTTPGFNW